jgi:hypothetical protein
MQIPNADRDGGEERAPEDDRLRRVVHAALAVYLMPAFVAVMAVGGVMLVVTKAVQAGSVAADALGFTRRRPSVAHWPKRVKAPLADRYGTGNFGPVHHASPRFGGGRSNHSSRG